MIVFLFNGLSQDEINFIASHLKDAPIDKPAVVTCAPQVNIECFDTENDKRFTGAEAIALFWKLVKENRF